jgi:2-C-methyl-D-erythritol 4-phosphate cytidylyltransferase
MKRAVILVAGGRGVRMESELPKQFIPLLGKPVLMHTLEVFHRWDGAARLVVALPPTQRPYWELVCRELDCKVPHRITAGGATRFESVRAALDEVSDCEWVGVHDGVRPLVTPEVIEACFAAAECCGAAIPVVPVVESLRECDGEASRPVDRTRYCTVQTPQVFRCDWLTAAYRQAGSRLFTDDASVVEAAGRQVCLVAGHPENIKITTPVDLAVAGYWMMNHRLS